MFVCVCVLLYVFMLVNTLAARYKLIICRLALPFISFASFRFHFLKLLYLCFLFHLFFSKIICIPNEYGYPMGVNRDCKRKSIIFAISLIFCLSLFMFLLLFFIFFIQIVCASSMRAKTKTNKNLK